MVGFNRRLAPCAAQAEQLPGARPGRVPIADLVNGAALAARHSTRRAAVGARPIPIAELEAVTRASLAVAGLATAHDNSDKLRASSGDLAADSAWQPSAVLGGHV